MKISKARLTKGGSLEVSFVDDDGNDITMKGKNPVHEDLKKRLIALIPYFAELTEQREVPMINWEVLDSEENESLLHRISVTGVSIKGEEECRQCMMTGKRTLSTSKVLSLCSPLTGFDHEIETYERCDDLRDAVDAFLYEAEAYVKDKKWSVVHTEINFDGNPDDPFGNVDVPVDVPIEDAVPA